LSESKKAKYDIDMILEGLIILFLVISIAYITIYYMKPTQYDGKPTYDISVQSNVLNNTNMPWNIGPCALRFGIYVTSAPRTVSKVDCIVSETALGPSCTDYSFNACKCNDTGCGNCSLTEGKYLSKLLWLGNSMEVWASGYTSQNDKPYIPTLLKIKTAKDSQSTNTYMETISLPAIPLQKWTIITIVKEGRRIDVYYGAVPVASSYTTYLPVPADNSQNMLAGNSAWKGMIGFFKGSIGHYTSDDVTNDVSSLVDTKGVPYYFQQINFDFNLNIPFCPSGNCNTLPVIKPKNPFAVYASTVS